MSRENGPKFRIIGTAPESIKRRAEQEITDLLTQPKTDSLPDEWKRALEESELPKTPQELSLIDFANQKINELMRTAGIPDFDVPANNFHLLPASTYEKFTQEKESYGATALLLQTVTLNADEVKKILWFSVALFSTK